MRKIQDIDRLADTHLPIVKPLPCCFGELEECDGKGKGCPDFLACREESYTLKMQADFPNAEIFIGVL